MEQRLIDANAVSEELSTMSMTITGLRAGKGVLNEFMTEYRKSVIEVIEDAPTVDAVPVVHGHWTRERGFIVCSQCSTRFRECIGAKSIMTYKGCPMCFAKMDEVSDETK